jgi:hypothetical protein
MKAQRFVTLALLVTLFTLAWGGDQTATADIHADPAHVTASEPGFAVPKNSPVAPTADPFTDIGAGLPGVYESAAAWGDYNNDGNLDILLMGCAGDCSTSLVADIYRNNSGVFTATNAGLTGADDGSVAWGDYDNDGNLDILLVGGGWLPSVSKVYRNNRSTFTDIGAVLAQVSWGAAAWGDYDNDGDLDILFSNGELYRNDGSGVFTNIDAGLSGGGDVAWGDYDNDGDLDILFSNGELYRNDGSGVFTNIDAGLPGVYGSAAGWGDYDNDGNLDILLTGDTGSTYIARVYHNNGDGTFSDIGAGLTGVYDGSVAWGDYDNDGNLDVLLAGDTYGDTTVAKVYRNGGGGTFTDIGASITGTLQGSAAWGDYDNDGKLDILLTGWNKPGYNYVAKVYRNDTANANTQPSAPTGLTASVVGRNVTLSWNAANDAQTPAAGLSYNLRVGTTPGGSQIVAPMAASNGYRRVPQLGNANQVLTKTLRNLPSGTYYWSVQAVDTAWAGSTFADEKSFTTTPLPVAGLNISGRTEGVTQVGYPFVAAVTPTTATYPITYTWQASGQVPITHISDGLTDTVTFTWTTPGSQVITVTADNSVGTATSTHLITISPLFTGTLLVVDTTLDSNDPIYRACTTAADDCSLRGAISRANAGVTNTYTIQVPAGIYTLTLSGDEDNNATGDLDVKSSLNLVGDGADSTVINGNQLDRVLHTQSGITVEIRDIQITGGQAITGGGIYNAGTLILDNCALRSNKALGSDGSTGSAGYSQVGTCGNGGNGDGGGNGSVSRGGGIYNEGMLFLNHSILSDNEAHGGNGGGGGAGGRGGDALFGTNGVMICAGGNGGSGGSGGAGSDGEGGAIYNAGTMTLSLGILSRNAVAGGNAGDGGVGGGGGWGNSSGYGYGYGGSGGNGGSGGTGKGSGIYNSGLLTLVNSTVISNTISNGGTGGRGGNGGSQGHAGAPGGAGGQSGQGGGIFNQGTVNLTNSVVISNTAGNGGSGGNGGDGSCHTIVGGVTCYRGGDGGNGGNGGNGGGLYNNGTLPIVNAIISHNAAGSGGAGGLPGSGLAPNNGAPGSGGSGSGLYITSSSPRLAHTTIARNVGGDGSGVYITDGSTLALTNTILVSHTVGISTTSDSTALIESILWGSGAWANGTNWVGGATVSHEYTGAPAFVNPDSDDYHIGPTSEAIDKGVKAGVTSDIDDQPRPNPDTGLPDLGADEYWVCTAINEIAIAGPVVGTLNTPVTFTAILTPSAPTPYIQYTWQPEPITGQGTAMVTYTFGTSGDYLISLAAQNCGGSRESVHTISIGTGWHYIYLPLVVRQP